MLCSAIDEAAVRLTGIAGRVVSISVLRWELFHPSTSPKAACVKQVTVNIRMLVGELGYCCTVLALWEDPVCPVLGPGELNGWRLSTAGEQCLSISVSQWYRAEKFEQRLCMHRQW